MMKRKKMNNLKKRRNWGKISGRIRRSEGS
jgi:hypothetical protein